MGTGAGSVDQARSVRVTLTASLLFTAGRADASVARGRARPAVRGDVRWCRVSTVESVRVSGARVTLLDRGTRHSGDRRGATGKQQPPRVCTVRGRAVPYASVAACAHGGAWWPAPIATPHGTARAVYGCRAEPARGSCLVDQRSVHVPRSRPPVEYWCGTAATGSWVFSGRGTSGLWAVAWAGCFSPRAVALCAAPCRRRRPLPATAVGGGFPRPRHRTG